MSARLGTMVLLVALASLPRLAFACPACLASPRPPNVLALVGVFMLVPFGVFAVVLRAVRRTMAERDSAERSLDP